MYRQTDHSGLVLVGLTHAHHNYIIILTSSFHSILFIFNNQQSLVSNPPTTSRCGPELQLINTLE